MKIYLFLINQIVSFNLPKEVFGSFSFDENDNNDTKLINIEARDGKWILYSTSNVSILDGNQIIEEIPITENNYYILRRDDINYLIYISDLFDSSFKAYSYDSNIDLTIGNSNDCSIVYNFEYIDKPIKIYNKNGQILLEKNKSTIIYINKKILELDEYYIKNGDQINIFGFKIIFLKELLLMNNPNNMVNINTTSINEYELNQDQDYQDIEIKDVNLYEKDDYYTKTPRLKRSITTKEIQLSPPPNSEKKEDLPLILTIGPMMTMGVMSGITLYRSLSKLIDGTGDLDSVLPQLIMSIIMLTSMLVWPNITRAYNKKRIERDRKKLIEKYTIYLNTKRQELEAERSLQKEILLENLITIKECLNIINAAKLNFWDRRLEQKDFLTVRIGVGNELLDAKVNYPEEGFSIDEDELRKLADQMIADYKYIPSVPIGYSFTENRITAIMGYQNKIYPFIDNIIIQMLTFCSYEDLKIVVFTTEENEDKWDYIKYLNHNFNNEKTFRFFSSNPESAKRLSEYLEIEFQVRSSYLSDANNAPLFKPYYIIFIDNYSELKRLDFIKNATEVDAPLGFSFIIIEKSLTNLPSKCNNFISLGENSSGVLKNSYERQEQLTFMDEINYTINMMSISKKLSNIPIEFQEGTSQLPDTVTFLEMEKVGKVEQLNILNRWNQNDSTQSLKTEIGLDADGNLMYLDLHEKYHGPHGLIAGMTGSGKSEFIITYILSMAINYSPDDVAFILIDYKGGGLAGAFENKVTNVYLPHLAGTITNLDKAEMDRTLVSIDSEVKRRQKIFNEARDQLNESTIDIYKYQGFYKEGKLTEPVPHLFIICDEFAELKAQQPEFMSNLISVARIGRSLGVHLILATQKPSGVVNEQIWSNSKFRVCLKVQSSSDSNEMLKRPDAASLKQTGRFYLQVGYDEYFALGQSAWCGAKYYPSEKIIKQVDRSVNFIDDTGAFIKSIQSGNKNVKIEEQGEQISAILKNIIEVSNKENKKAKRLWLNNIEPIIINDTLHEKYNIQDEKYDIKAIIGEYDAPEVQEQGILTYSLKEDGNTIIVGNENPENEKLINTILYSICKYHDSSEVNIYIIDYGSEELRMFSNLPQIGGMTFVGEVERFNNLFKLIRTTIKERKMMLTEYGGSIDNYNSKNEKKLNQVVLILNNYEGIFEATRGDIAEILGPIARDCERYGIILIISCTSFSSINRKISQFCKNRYCLKINDKADYAYILSVKVNNKPRDIFGRGLVYNGGAHEFQTASLVDENHSESEFLDQFTKEVIKKNSEKAIPIPELPEIVTMDMIKEKIDKISNVPIGIARDTLDPVIYNFNEYASTIITANIIDYTKNFVQSLLDILTKIKNLTIVFIDGTKEFTEAKQEGISYINENYDANIKNLVDVENKIINNLELNIVYIIYGIDKFINKLDKKDSIEQLANSIKKSDNSNLIVIDGFKGIKNAEQSQWFLSIKNSTDGIWIGKGFGNQSIFRVNKITKEMNDSIKNEYGYYIKESEGNLLKFIEFHINKNEEEEEAEYEQ